MFDNCVISSISYYLYESDDLQFFYEENIFTVLCEVIHYYVNQNSCVYMCMLDTSKAFD